ncbi:acylphosphatase [Candidatus Falkowbacteria bacterium]|nr:acylphosphatase [Candidatus Falkowbacteria bacterium]
MKHLNITLKGKVQGVFFRVSAREKARQLGLNGFCRNEADGSLYLEAEGDDEALAEFIKWCRVGPPAARVDKLEKEEVELKDYDEFQIKYR